MGRGDKKTKKGKVTIGSYGVKRPRTKSTVIIPEKDGAAKEIKASAPKAKAKAKTAKS